MDEVHQLIGVFSVFFAVAQEDIGIKRLADLFSCLVIDERCIEILFQLVRIADLGQIRTKFCQELALAKELRPAVDRQDALTAVCLKHDWQYRTALQLGEGEVSVPSGGGIPQQFERHGKDEQVHRSEVSLAGVLRKLVCHVFFIENGAVVRLEDVLANGIKGFLEIIWMTGKIDLRLLAGIAVAFCTEK